VWCWAGNRASFRRRRGASRPPGSRHRPGAPGFRCEVAIRAAVSLVVIAAGAPLAARLQATWLGVPVRADLPSSDWPGLGSGAGLRITAGPHGEQHSSSARSPRLPAPRVVSCREAQLIGGQGVVFVDDWHHPPAQQLAPGCGSVLDSGRREARSPRVASHLGTKGPRGVRKENLVEPIKPAPEPHGWRRPVEPPTFARPLGQLPGRGRPSPTAPTGYQA